MIENLLIGLWNAGWLVINIENLYPIVRALFLKERKEETSEVLESLPRISILLAAYQEEITLEACIERLLESDYPSERLEVIILTEADDPTTGEIADALSKHPSVKHIVIPPDKKLPKGKPRALNEGLKYATGEIIGVIDAEDLIDLSLFKTVAVQIRKGMDVVQGILDMANHWDGWKSHQFRGEYGFWFRVCLPSLAKIKWPVPLGGTTNFFKRSILEELGGWDSWNVTEDFDLGMRIYNAGYKVAALKDSVTKRTKASIFVPRYQISTINSVTKEESPRSWKSWLKQRTRWQRGKIQTLKKLIKSPPKELWKKFHSFMACFSPHMGIINLSGIILSLLAWAVFRWQLAIPLLIVCWINLSFVVFYACQQGIGFIKATEGEKVGLRRLRAIGIAISLPAYWIMQWIADIRAVWQEYIKKTVFWEKTRHEGRHFKTKG